MGKLYPLKFKPIFQSYIWGGRRLESVLGKQLPGDGDFAESWEVVDHKDGQSEVANGDLQGWTLSKLVQEKGAELFGKHNPQPKFPLLFKFLDCNRNLSVQVHPNDEQGSKLTPPDLGKTEAWVVLAANPGSILYAGLKAGVGREEFETNVKDGTTKKCLHRIQPHVGDCIFIPAGTVHALGEGLVVAEIQQSSNTTFRLFDWNRVGADGNPRPLHIEEGIAVIDYERGPVAPQVPIATDRANVERLVGCEKFILDRVIVRRQTNLGGDNGFHIVAVLEGNLECNGVQFTKGETMLLPASCGEVEIKANGTVKLLDMYLP